MNERSTTMPSVMDAVLPIGLLLALAVVVGLDRASPPEVSSAPVVTVTPAPAPPTPVRRLRLGVTPEMPEFDDMAKLLDTLGEGYQYTKFDLDDLIEPEKINRYDVIFLTCSGMGSKWLNERVGRGQRDTDSYTPNLETLAKAKECLRGFVQSGGTLYASDLHFLLVAECFPEFVDREKVDSGKEQTVHAQVVEPGLRELIGGELDLRFDKPGWRPAAFAGEKVTVFMRGDYQSDSDGRQTSPLLVKFTLGDGAVIFTSFHNEKQNSATEMQLLRYLVFSAITAGAETQAANKMVQGGFSPSKRNLFSASGQRESVSQKYETTKVADLQFVLAFADQGARLQLTVKPPGGPAVNKEGASTITIDVPRGPAGVYEYTVTALSLPNTNFPFTVTVGQK